MTMHAKTLLSLLMALASSCSAFQLTHPVMIRMNEIRRPTAATNLCRPSSFILRSSQSDESQSQGDNSSEAPLSAASDSLDDAPSPPRVVSSVTAQPRRRSTLDPLVASLTRMDEETLQAKRTNIPLWGELILDKSLIVFIPVVAFALIGFGMSIYVILNSQDAIVEALMDATEPDYLKGVAEPVVTDPNACRGLCGSQQDDLESLRGFMSGFGGGGAAK